MFASPLVEQVCHDCATVYIWIEDADGSSLKFHWWTLDGSCELRDGSVTSYGAVLVPRGTFSALSPFRQWTTEASKKIQGSQSEKGCFCLKVLFRRSLFMDMFLLMALLIGSRVFDALKRYYFLTPDARTSVEAVISWNPSHHCNHHVGS